MVHVLPRDEEPLQPQEVHLNTEDERTWAIPVFGGILVAGVLIGALVIRRKPSEPETVRSDSAVKPPAEGGSGEPELSIDDRLLLEDELDAFEDG